jgi:hypothetical protein
MHEAIRTYFETPERLLVYQQEWMAISLQRIINNNPDKTRLECLELMLTDIRKLQPGVPPAPSKDQQLRDRAYSAVLGVPECDMALQIAPPTWQGLCNALRTSIATAIRSGKSQEQFTQYDDPDPDQYLVDRSYAGRGGYRGRGRGGFKESHRGGGYREGNGFYGRSTYSRVNSRSKRCYVCKKEGCWSTKHTEDEKRKAYDDFKRASQYPTTSDEYQHFLVDYEGVEPDPDDARRIETEQLLLEWGEDIYGE